MKCPFCANAETKVVDKRHVSDFNFNRRRRECIKCAKRFTTYERIEIPNLSVIKKDGRLESFDRNKILNGILRSCEKRPIVREQIDRMVNEIEEEIKTRSRKKIKSSKIGEIIIRKLKKLDKVAYIRFASVYKEFEDIDSFEKEIKNIGKRVGKCLKTK
ncbi:MAG TPA: transcriptional repressor NrdR [Candidatus Woesearchaeota archaeon]|nr:transcriptional repressor NrdR [Candidatus Woesearchaeota archaeon]